LYAGRRIRGPEDAAHLVRQFLADADREVFLAVCLNTKNEPTAISTVSVGTLNSSVVHPRELFKFAILSSAAGVILAHNHPSGDVEPSDEDCQVTGRLVEAGKLLGIEVLDHPDCTPCLAGQLGQRFGGNFFWPGPKFFLS